MQLVSCSSFGDYPKAAVTSLLLAMKYSSLEAQRLFPRLLQLVANHSEIKNDFVERVSHSMPD
jgi:hypothetical protein